MNYVEFVDGRREEIIWWKKVFFTMTVMTEECIEFVTTSGHYVYESRIMSARGGIKYRCPWFAEIVVDHCALGARVHFRECMDIHTIYIKEETK